MNNKRLIVDIRKEVIDDARRRRLSTNFEMLCDEVLNHYERQYVQIQTQFKRVLRKYNFKKLLEKKLIDDEEYLHVSLSVEQSCKDTYVCLDKGGGITELDFEIGKISEEPSVNFYDNLEYFDFLSGEFDEWEKFHKKILLSILILVWIDLEGFNEGIVVKLNENGSGRQFFFNDLEWDEESIFFDNNSWIEKLRELQITERNSQIIYQMICKG